MKSLAPVRPVGTGRFESLAQAWRRSLVAANRSPQTVKLYTDGLRQFHLFLLERGMPTSPEHITREHVETFVTELLERGLATNTVRARYRALYGWFRWLIEDGELDRSPMARTKEPKHTAEPPAVLSREDLERILKACEGNGFMERRDLAIFSVLIDTGVRVGELAGMTVEALDLDAGLVLVDGKTGKRLVSLGQKTTLALDRYIRARDRHKHAGSRMLWVGRQGPLTNGGLYGCIVNRAAKAGVKVNPHEFRHTWVSDWLESGGSEGDAMSLGGWVSAAVMRRYGRATAVKRALAAHKKSSPRDRLNR